MSEDFHVGQSALFAAVPEAEAAVGAWRARYDYSAPAGVPAHVTVLYPFLDGERLDEAVLGELRELFAAVPPFPVRFERFGRFPGVLYLAPEPAVRLNALTDAVAARWPEAPPYGGRYDEVVAHLTVADRADAATQAEIEAEVGPRLPIDGRIETVSLYVYDGRRWGPYARFGLGA